MASDITATAASDDHFHFLEHKRDMRWHLEFILRNPPRNQWHPNSVILKVNCKLIRFMREEMSGRWECAEVPPYELRNDWRARSSAGTQSVLHQSKVSWSRERSPDKKRSCTYKSNRQEVQTLIRVYSLSKVQTNEAEAQSRFIDENVDLQGSTPQQRRNVTEYFKYREWKMQL